MRISGGRIATVLWMVCTIVVWNVVLDQTIVLAGRRYIVAAVAAAQGPGPYARIDDWMRPAAVRGFWFATAAAAAMLAIGMLSIRLATRADPRSRALSSGD